ncbi:class I SAM-dependent methyltransferase [bacterium]|nr:class I SAM-dependent methyltransferase [bacterium]
MENNKQSAARLNLEFYGQPRSGTTDYWRKMAAPRFRRATIKRLLSRVPMGPLVDLGCGGGQFLSELMNSPRRSLLTGIDLSEPQLEQNRVQMPHIQWQCADLCSGEPVAPHLRDHFTAVIAMELIEHVQDPGLLLRNALALARPGQGHLLLSTQSGPIRPTEVRVGHIQHFTARQMDSLLRQSGWEPIQVWNAGFPFHDLSKWYANRNPQASLQQFGDKPYGFYENLVCYILRWLFQFNSNRFGAQLFALAKRPEV